MLIHNYSNLSIKTPDCHPNSQNWVARFNMDAEVSHLFPYIKAEFKDSLFYKNPDFIKFTFDGIACALYPQNAIVAPFADRNEAVNFIDRFIAFLNDIDSRKDSITPSFEYYEHISVLDILKKLPKTNCKECGLPSCMAFANAVSNGDKVLEECPKICN